MANMSVKKVAMPVQDGSIRKNNVDEVALGYSYDMAVEEAQRCLNCVNRPCVQGCPVHVDIPSFIAQIKEGKIEEAHRIIQQSSALPAICGRVCPQENQCEKHCVRGIKGESVAIGRLERFVADEACGQIPQPLPKNGHKVAIVGAGPSGLTCAGDLVKWGYEVTIYEALHVAGGVLVYGIPEFRLPKHIVQKEIDALIQQGVKIECNSLIGRLETLDELFDQGYEAIYLGTGAGLPRFMNLKGENLNGVFSANEYLTRFNLMKAYETKSETPIYRAKHAIIVGGGNVAMDAARCARRLGAEVSIVYRRSREELPARLEEVEHAMEEGIQFHFLCNPTQILGEKGWVKGIECVKMELGEPDASMRRQPFVVEGSEFVLPCDCVIMAIGTSPNPLIRSTTQGLETNSKGCILVDATGQTTREGVFAGGDAVSGAATVIQAMGAGKQCAQSIHAYIQNKGEQNETSNI